MVVKFNFLSKEDRKSAINRSVSDQQHCKTNINFAHLLGNIVERFLIDDELAGGIFWRENTRDILPEFPTKTHKEYVSPLIGLYKNNGSVLHVDNFFLFIHRLYTARTVLLMI